MKTFKEIAELHYAGEPPSTIDAMYKRDRINDLEQLLTEQLNLACVTNPVKIMDWSYTETEKPHAYLIGNWDGRNSDNVVAEGKSGKQYLAHYCEGFMDGSEFSDWYENSDFLINEEIVRWLPIPS